MTPFPACTRTSPNRSRSETVLTSRRDQVDIGGLSRCWSNREVGAMESDELADRILVDAA